jgi:hypothetical protein
VIRVFAFPETPDGTIGFAGGDRFAYRLSCGDGMVDEARLEMDTGAQWIAEPSDREHPTDSSLPCVLFGHIDAIRDEDVVRVKVDSPGRWRIEVRSREFGSNLDPIVEVLNAEGGSIAKLGESGEIGDLVLSNQLTVPGEYRIAVRDLHGTSSPEHRYRLAIEPEVPTVRGSLANDVVSGSVGNPIEIDVEIERTIGCAEEAIVSVVGLPSSARCEPVVSKADGDSAKKVRLVIHTTEKCSIPFRMELAQTGRPEHYLITPKNSNHSNLWLVVTP